MSFQSKAAGSAARVGLIGMGHIGRYVYDQIMEHPEWGLEVAFVNAATNRRLGEVPEHLILRDLADFAAREPDLVVEMAHPSVTEQYGCRFLGTCDYLPLSMTALASAELESSLLGTARKQGTRLFVPHGAVVGLDGIFESREIWEQVTIIMKKNPRNLDFTAAPGLKPPTGAEPTVLYDGPTRGLCPLFPRNVNSHATVALAGIGFDRTRSVLVSDPTLEVSVIELEAQGQGVALTVRRSNPLQGVSGVLTLRSTVAAIRRVKGSGDVLQTC